MKLLSVLLGWMLAGPAGAAMLNLHYGCPSLLSGDSTALAIAYDEYPPAGEPLADILFFHGFADSYRNHLPLFRSWTDAGFRVIGFDYPGHGASDGERGLASIDGVSFRGLMGIARQVQEETRHRTQRPLLLAGWSTGGLLAVRLVQSGRIATWKRDLRGLLLLAPGVPSRSFVGRQSFRYPLGEVTLDTLTHETEAPPMPIHPRSPGSVPFFAAHLWWNSMLAYRQRLPSGVPALVVVGGEREDRYVDTARILRWARWQRPGVVYPFQCPRARHWITREPAEYGGPEAITLTREFAAALAAGTPLDEVVGGVICRAVN